MIQHQIKYIYTLIINRYAHRQNMVIDMEVDQFFSGRINWVYNAKEYESKR